MDKKKIMIIAGVVLLAVFVLYRSKQTNADTANPYAKTEPQAPPLTNETAPISYVEQLRKDAGLLTKIQTDRLWALKSDVVVEAGKSSFREEHAYQLARVLALPDVEFYFFFNDIWFQRSNFADLGKGHTVFESKLAQIQTRLEKMSIPIK